MEVKGERCRRRIESERWRNGEISARSERKEEGERWRREI